jgi:predicted ester cyclase
MADLEQLMRRGTDAWNARDEAGLEAVSTDDITQHASGGVEANGIQAVHEFNRNWWTAFPDAKAEILECIVSGNTAVVRGRFTGTHTGVFKTPMGDIQPTNKPLDGRYVQIDHFRDDKAAESYLLFDRMEVMEQLGLVPTPATA